MVGTADDVEAYTMVVRMVGGIMMLGMCDVVVGMMGKGEVLLWGCGWWVMKS